MAARKVSEMDAETPPVVAAPKPPPVAPAPPPPEDIPAGPMYGPPVPVRMDMNLHKDGGGFLGGAVGAIGGAVTAVVRVADAVKDVALNSVAVQAAAAVMTGGLSLAAQAAVEKATGKGGPVTGFVGKAVTDPLSVVKALPGTVLTETGLVGAVADVASAIGAATAAAAPGTKLGKVAAAVNKAVEGVQQASKDNPVASLTVIAGVAGTALGLPGAAKLLGAGVEQLAGGKPPPPTAQQGNTGIVPVQQPQVVPAAEAAAPKQGSGAAVALAGAALAAAAALAALA